jgi:hypothetical protein
VEIFCRNKIILAILTFPLTEIQIIFTHLIVYFLTNLKIINLAMQWQENAERHLQKKKVAPVASRNQLVQHEKKNS